MLTSLVLATALAASPAVVPPKIHEARTLGSKRRRCGYKRYYDAKSWSCSSFEALEGSPKVILIGKRRKGGAWARELRRSYCSRVSTC